VGENYKTVFEVSLFSNGVLKESVLFLSVGIAVAIIGIFAKWYKRPARIQNKIAIWSWLAIIVPFSSIWLIYNIEHGQELTQALKNGRCETVEGLVTVHNEQSSQGHGPGDLIQIAGKELTINYWTCTLGYNQTISHGGELQNGVFARLHYVGDEIIKVEIKQ